MKDPVDDAKTGLPGLRTWKQVYSAVITTFILWVVLLVALGRMFS
jgi:hypothetical protein